MSDYVYNYVFCSFKAVEDFKTNYEIDFIAGCYGIYYYRVSDDRFLMIFDTRGRDYKKDFIERFITQYKDTKWYCVEEEEVEEGFFYWDQTRVELVSRHLLDSENFHYTEDYIEIHVTIAPYRPIVTILITEKEMIIEYILQNRASNYTLSEDSITMVWDYVMSIMKNTQKYRRNGLKTLYEFGIPVNNRLVREMRCYWINNTVNIDISSFDENDTWQNDCPDGNDIFNDAISLVKAIVKQEGRTEDIIIENELIDNSLERLN